MSFDTAQSVVDFVMRLTPSGQRIDFSFFGGEPLLCFDLMKKITSYIREKERKEKKPIRFNMTTNGTILAQSTLDFLKEENVHLCISLDGSQYVQNLNRYYQDGHGSFAVVVNNLQKALEQLDSVQVNAVYGPETLDFLPESVSFFVDLGVHAMHLNPNVCVSWPRNIFSKLQQKFMQIADFYIESYQQGREIAVNFIDSKIILFLKGGYTAGDMCGMGETQWAFSPGGNIYPCARFIGEDSNSLLCLGNVHTGLDLVRRCTLLEQKGNRVKECKKCDLQPYCMNWCGCTNYYMTGYTDLAGPTLCAIEKGAINAARHVLMTLTNLENELFMDHFTQYFHGKGRHYQELPKLR
jgi:uncharacterized protein